jgi:hypothetical protein
MRSLHARTGFGSLGCFSHSMSPRRDRHPALGVELMETRALLSGCVAGSSAYRTFNAQPDPPAVVTLVKPSGQSTIPVLQVVSIRSVEDPNQ